VHQESSSASKKSTADSRRKQSHQAAPSTFESKEEVEKKLQMLKAQL